MSKLTEQIATQAQAKGKPYKIADGGGMYLLVQPTGSKWWRLRYRFGGKEKQLALGVYPDVTLTEARDRRDNARRLLANGIDPSEERKMERALEQEENARRKIELTERLKSMRMVSFPDGVREIWHGRNLIARLTDQQARELRDLLNGNIGGENGAD